ncbi:unnamed protein product [Camellia sinensis]
MKNIPFEAMREYLQEKIQNWNNKIVPDVKRQSQSSSIDSLWTEISERCAAACWPPNVHIAALRDCEDSKSRELKFKMMETEL